MAEGQLGQASFQISLAGTESFLAGLNRVRSASQQTAVQTQQELDRVTQGIDEQIASLTRLKAAQGGIGTSRADGQIAQLQAQREEIQRTIQALRQKEQAELRGQSVALNSEQAIAARIARLREERSAVELNSKAYQNLSRQIAGAERQQRGGGALQGLAGALPGQAGMIGSLAAGGSGALALGAAVGAAGAAVTAGVQKFAEYNAALLQLGALSGANRQQLGAMSEAIAATAAASGISKTELAALGTELARTGFSAEQITKALDGVVTVAQATGEDVQTAAGVVGQALKLWNLPAQEAGRVGDMLAKSANLSSTSLGSLAETLKYVGPAAVGANQSLEDVVTLTTLLAEAGIKGSMAGTGLTAVLTRLKTASAGLGQENSDLVRGNAKRVEAFNQIGASVRNTDGTMRSLLTVLPQIKAKLDALTPQDRDLISNALFGEEGGRAFLALVNQSTEKMGRFSEGIRNSAGESKKLQQQQQGLALQLNRTGQAFGGLLESLGNLADAMGLGLALQGLSLILSGLAVVANKTAEALRFLLVDAPRALGSSLVGGNPDEDTKRIQAQTDALREQRKVQRETVRDAELTFKPSGLNESLGRTDPTEKRIAALKNQAELEKKNFADFQAVYGKADLTQQLQLTGLFGAAEKSGTNVKSLLESIVSINPKFEPAKELLRLYKELEAAKNKARPDDGGVASFGNFINAQREVRAAFAEQSSRSTQSIAGELFSRQEELRVVTELAGREGEIGEIAKKRKTELESQTKALEAQLQVRREQIEVEARISANAQQFDLNRLDSYSRLTDQYRQQVSLGAQLAAEQGGIRTDALQARLQDLERNGQGDSGAALALKREIFAEEKAIAEQKQASDRQSLQYEALKLGYSQQRARIEAEIAVNQARAGLLQAQLDRSASGATPGSPQAALEDQKVLAAQQMLQLAQQRLQLLGPEQQAERQNLELQQRLLGVQQERANAAMTRRGQALGIVPEESLALKPGESRGVLLRPDPSLSRELSSAYEASTAKIAQSIAGTLGQTGAAQTQLLSQIAQKETSIVVNVDSSGAVSTAAGMRR
jgi:TP901 family phage tail tape measure protein